MAFQLSPGVLVQEQDLTHIVPAVATTPGGFAGVFNWGPVDEIINISSQYASRVPNPYLYVNLSEPSAIQYNVAKAALNKLTKELAVRFADQNIRVNSIEFGGIEGRATDTFVQRYNSKAPHGRMLKLAECYGPIKMLLDNDSQAINGAVIEANAGWTLC